MNLENLAYYLPQSGKLILPCLLRKFYCIERLLFYVYDLRFRNQCNNYYEDVCSTYYKPECKQNFRRKCENKPEEVCNDYWENIRVPYEKTECDDIPHQRCKGYWEEKRDGTKVWIEDKNDCETYYETEDHQRSLNLKGK